jgi:hypothetical protein
MLQDAWIGLTGQACPFDFLSGHAPLFIYRRANGGRTNGLHVSKSQKPLVSSIRLDYVGKAGRKTGQKMEGLHMTTPTPMDELIAALKAAKGHMLNAKIDLETNAPKRAAINTLNAGLDLIDVALRTTKL